jgi:GAF domain-containing protein
MTALPQDAVADLNRRIAELERQLESAVDERDAAIERQTANALVNFRLKSELRAATERQNASAEILSAIANTHGDAEHALQRIAETTQHFFNAASVTIRIAEGDRWVQTVRVGSSAHLTGSQPASDSITRGANLPGTIYQENRQIHIPDLDNVDPSMADWPVRAARGAGIRTVCGSPLRRDGKAIGVLIVFRDRLAAFTDQELALQQSFADQAVIAIENARLFNATEKALARQTATSDILRVISSSPTDVQPVFDAIVQSAVRLLGCETSFIQRCDGTHFWTVARCTKEGLVPVIQSRHASIDPGANFPSRAILAKQTLYLPDWSEIELPEFERRIQRELGYNSAIYLPLLREGECIGILGIAGSQPRMFSEADIALAESFSDQALIAIENTRLFNETKEALERQTATADVLRVIASSPSDVAPVFEAIVGSAKRLLGGFTAAVFRLIDENVHLAAYTPTNPAADEALKADFPQPVENFEAFRLAQHGKPFPIPDTEEVSHQPLRDIARLHGFRSMLWVPITNGGTTIGIISVTRAEPGAFAPHHVQLLQTFADQAVIAIENARLFNETQEALERQTATADILKVIASSPSDVQPVFDVIVERAVQLCGGRMGRVYRYDGGVIQMVAGHGLSAPGLGKVRQVFPRPATDDTISGQVMLSHRPYFVTDIQHDDSVPPLSRQMIEALGTRSQVTVPMLRTGEAIGAITVGWADPGAVGDQQVSLLQTFADQAVIAIENVRLFNETKEALERQTATADILKVIASSPSDVQPVFEAIVGSAAHLFEPCAATITTLKDNKLHWNAAATSISGFDVERTRTVYPIPFDPERAPSARAILERRIIELPDVESPDTPEFTRKAAAVGGFRSITFVPLVDQHQGIGTIIFTHQQPGFKFSDKQLALVQTFADQAVIAIQNTRLFNETREALERQTATADILKVIASSPSDVQPVFDAIADSANRLLGGFATAVIRFIDEMAHLQSFTPTNPTADELLKSHFPRPVEGFEVANLARQGRPVMVTDTEATGDTRVRDVARVRGFRSMLIVPLMSGRVPIGIVSVTRVATGSFPDHHVQLLKTFADQAVIAIENARLFNEVQERTVELTEALEQQTATAEVLGVISSSAGDLAPVFDAMLGKAMQLCSANFGVLNTYDGKAFHTAATYGLPPAYDEYRRKQPQEYGPATAPARLLEGEPFVQFTDLLESEAYRNGEPNRCALVDIGGARCLLAVPLVKDEHVVGNVMIFRQENRPFSEKQIALLQQFAAQAVIAIENTRLLRELRESTEDLSESLQQQTATSEVLQIISSSPSDLAPVFDKMLENATRVCGAEFGSMTLVEGDTQRQAALYNAPPAFAAVRINKVLQIHPRSSIAAAVRTKQVVQVEDLRNYPAYLEGNPASIQLAELGGARTLVVVPMLRDDEVIGAITVFRQEVRPFGEKQIELLSNFAKQAVIAIENARLLRELRERTDDLSESLQQQTATSEVLQIISTSPGDLAPVFDKMLENATRVCGGEFGSMVLIEDGDTMRSAALYNAPPELVAARANWTFKIHPQSSIGRAFREKRVIQTEDLRQAPSYLEGNRSSVELAELGGARTIVVVPMLREDDVIGMITVYRQEVRLFGDKQIDLLRNFARQAVIAIENARLLRELRERTDDLSESLQFQTATSDVLKVISRSPDALQPVLDAIAETSRELCGSDGATIFVLSDGKFHLTAVSGELPAHLQFMQSNPVAIGQPGSVLTRIVREKRSLHIPNVMDDPELREGAAGVGGARALLAAPLMRDGEVVGVIILRQSHLKPFTPRQIQAIETFADQAVIAISNVNLFEQVQQRTRELSKSLDDLRTAQDRLIQTEKLASLGQLTAGIAHEIKNPLNFVNNFAALSSELTDELNDVLKPAVLDETLRAEVDELTGTLKDNLGKVVQHGKRADSIVKNMLLHSREGTGEHRPADVNALVDESLNLAYHGARAEKPQFNVTLQRDFDPAAGMIEVFPQEITRVLLNLISNGFYAVTKRKADNGAADFEPLVTATTRGRDDHVEIRIRDNGTGIPPEVKEKMFNPFFTTKPAGEGTGLGLSMSHDIIVKQHGGSIDVETQPGAFTEFRLVLPRTSSAAGKAGSS